MGVFRNDGLVAHNAKAGAQARFYAAALRPSSCCPAAVPLIPKADLRSVDVI